MAGTVAASHLACGKSQAKVEAKKVIPDNFIIFSTPALSKIEILNTRERLQLKVKLGIEATWRKYLQNSSKSYAKKLVPA
ncbi:hypothetical protein [Nostoc sp.]|uniref:hypothetical protein n=1 Tax=Nostoc sp. TaxID=1180 RepID=UPI002FFAF791